MGLGFRYSAPLIGASYANAVSADGLVVVGDDYSCFSIYECGGTVSFRWTQAGGMVGIKGPGERASVASSVSGDGSVVVGFTPVVGCGPSGWRWTQAGGPVGLGGFPGGCSSDAHGVSADGSVVVGVGDHGSTPVEAFRWTQASGVVGLGLLAGYENSSASGVSADGSVVVGYTSILYTDEAEAFRWTQDGGMVGLGYLDEFGYQSYANAVSADGSVIVGDSDGQAFRWTQADGMVGLDPLRRGGNSGTLAVSADGSVVVGGGFNAFYWTQAGGVRPLRDMLVNDLGLDLNGWTLSRANGVSADGLTIVGDGIDPRGFDEAWIAHIPEPSSLAAIGVLAGLALARHRRFRLGRRCGSKEG